MTIPKAFISYSHDSQEHKKWVLDFATRLRNIGVDAMLDQWDIGPGDDIPHFMERSLAAADRVLMICTEKYVEKANAGAGGVGYEKMIVTADLMRKIDSNKIIPVVRQMGGVSLPTFLGSKFYLNFSRDDQYESSFDDLARALHNAPLFVKPPISNNPFTPVASSAKRSGDALLELMAHVVRIFERMSDPYIAYSYLVDQWSGSRVMLDILIDQAEKDGLITVPTSNYLSLTTKGKMYAMENKLIQ